MRETPANTARSGSQFANSAKNVQPIIKEIAELQAIWRMTEDGSFQVNVPSKA